MKQIMVVDNHPVMLKFMSNQLENKGYRVATRCPAERRRSPIFRKNRWICSSWI
ncbi:MAG: response regulator [Desulfobacteraceae bacterium]|nr:response regulator [Desulfobacteraceae bacterium]